jgi:hypothetical protein
MFKIIILSFVLGVSAGALQKSFAMQSFFDDSINTSNQEKSGNAEDDYNDEFNDYAKMLNEFRFSYNPSKARPEMIIEDEDLELYPKFSDLKLALNSNISSIITPNKLIAAAPLGTYLQEKKGWTGFKLFYKEDKDTTCAYAFINLALSHGKIILADEDQNFFVGTKHGYKLSSGTDKSGYVYSVNWYDSEHVHMLDCATVKYDVQGINKTVKIANQIDATIK